MRALRILSLLIVPVASAADLDFYKDVYPFLKANCIACHNKTTTKADLNMETPELMLKGGENGPGLVPGKGAESLVVKAALHQDDMEMPPPNNKSGAVDLSAAEIALFKQWIDQGAKASKQEQRAVTLQTISASVDPIYCVAMSRDGRYAACGRSNHITIYDLATRQAIAQLSDPSEQGGAAHRAMVQSLAFSPDGTRLASGSYREVKLWKVESIKAAPPAMASPPAPADWLKKISASAKITVVNGALSADGKQAAVACTDGSVRVFDVAAGKQLTELSGTIATTKRMGELEWIVAAQNLETAFQKSEIIRIEAQNKALDVLLGKAKEAIVTMNKVLPEKRKAVPPATEAKAKAQKLVDELIAAKDPAKAKELKAAQDKLITATTAETSALAAVTAAEGNISDAEADVKRITDSKASNAKITASANAAIATAKATQDKATADITTLKQSLAKPSSKPTAVTFIDAARIAAQFDDGSTRSWGIATGMPIEEAITPSWKLERKLATKGLFADRVNAVRFSPDGKTLATAGGELSRSGDIHFFESATGKLIRAWKDKHTDTVLCIDFSPDGKRLASGAADKIARVTDIASGKQLGLFEGHTHHVTGLSYRSDGRVLASAGADGTVVTWDLLLGERKKKVEGWTKEVTSVQFVGATDQIVTSAGDNRVRLINDEGKELRSIANLPDYMQAAAASPNGSIIIGGGEDSTLRVWDSAGKEVAAFQSIE